MSSARRGTNSASSSTNRERIERFVSEVAAYDVS